MSSTRRSRSRRLKRLLGNALVIVLGIIALLLLIGLFLPRTYHVERSTEIRARPEVIYGDLATLRRWPEWTVWNRERDPKAEFRFDSPETGAGAGYEWNGPELGRGKLRLTKAEPAQGVWYDLAFDNGEFRSEGSLLMVPSGDSVRVTWVNEGTLGRNPVYRYMGLMMDSMVGPDFEKGLANLKARAEGTPRTP